MHARQLMAGVLFGVLVFAALLPAQADPLLWQARHPALPGTVWLFGSLHFGKPELYPLPPVVENALDRADVLAVEVDLERMHGPGAQLALRHWGRLPPEQQLEHLLTPEDWAQLQTVAEQQGLPPQLLQGWRPWRAAIALVSAQLLASDFREQDGVDRYLLRRWPDERPVLELEGLGQQLRLFDDMSPAQDRRFLVQTLAEFEQGPAFLDALYAAWRAGDQTRLENLVLAPFQGHPLDEALYQRLFVERNRQMTAKIVSEMHQPQTLFVVVGSGHLLGEHGLPALLAARGFTVSQHSGLAL